MSFGLGGARQIQQKGQIFLIPREQRNPSKEGGAPWIYWMCASGTHFQHDHLDL